MSASPRSELFARFRVSQSIIWIAIFIVCASGCNRRAKIVTPNTLRLTAIAKVKGLDPIQADDYYSGLEVAKAYDGLFEYEYLKRPYQLKENLAESLPQFTDSGKLLTLRIKKGVLFQDDPAFQATGGKGRELVSEDFIYSWKRLADPKNTSPGWWVFEGKILGLDEWRAAAAKSGTADYTASIEGLRAVDDHTLQIRLKQRSEQFLYFLAMPFTAVVPREVVEKYGPEFLNHPVGTGPFRLVEFSPGSRLIWEKNPSYRKDLYPTQGEPSDRAAGLLSDAGKQLPFVDRIEVAIIEESQPRWLNFMQGNLDLIEIPKDNFSSAITASKELVPEIKSKGVQLYKSPELDVTHTSFNLNDPILGKNKLLRQALSLAIDMDHYIELFYNGRAIAAQGPIPPGLGGYDSNFKNPYRQFNVARAKELLAKAGYPAGNGLPELEYIGTSTTANRQTMEHHQKAFADIGVKLKLTYYSWPEFQAAIKKRQGQLWSYAWRADYPDAENFLQMFYSKNLSPGPNDAGYVNAEFDAMYEQSLQMPDGVARNALYQKMTRFLAEDCPWIFEAHRVGFHMAQGRLHNLKLTDVSHNFAKFIRVDPLK